MGHINEALGAAGAPIPMPVANKTYYLSPLTQKRQAEVETWLEERALASAVGMKKHLNEDQYVSLLHKVSGDIAANAYGFGGQEYRKAIATWAGIVQLLRIFLVPNHPDLKIEEVEGLLEDHYPEVRVALEKVLANYLRKMGVDREGQPSSDPPPAA